MEVTILALGGGIYCLQSIHGEMESNTFDYQRITRLTPLNLVLGKLFGAPSLAYFVVLCLIPGTLVAASFAHLSISALIWIYVILFLGALTLHALALSMSALVGRSSSVGAIILFLLLVYILAFLEGNGGSTLGLQSISPYFVNQIMIMDGIGLSNFRPDYALPAGKDFLFGQAVPHTFVLVVLYLTLTAWFLFGLVRNVKRDPQQVWNRIARW